MAFISYTDAVEHRSSSKTWGEAGLKAGMSGPRLKDVVLMGPANINESIHHCKLLQLLTSKPMRLRHG